MIGGLRAQMAEAHRAAMSSSLHIPVVVRTLNVIHFHINIMDKNTIFGTHLYTILFKNVDGSNLKC